MEETWMGHPKPGGNRSPVETAWMGMARVVNGLRSFIAKDNSFLPVIVFDL